jgi:F-type H+-transporting ATPase subunit delta
MRLSPVTRNVLGLMAQKRRLFVLPQFLEVLRARMSEARGEVAAEVVSAQPLTPTSSSGSRRPFPSRPARPCGSRPGWTRL